MKLVITISVPGAMPWIPSETVRQALVELAESLPLKSLISPGSQYSIRDQQSNVTGQMQVFEGSVFESTAQKKEGTVDEGHYQK